MATPEELAAGFLQMRPATKLGRRLSPDVRAIEEIGRATYVFEVRSLVGETLTVEIEGSIFVFVDTTATEIALHLFDVCMVPVATNARNEILRLVERKRLSRSLFCIGFTIEAQALAALLEDEAVSFLDATTPLTPFIEPQRRERFERRVSEFLVQHEFSHIAQARDRDLAMSLRQRCRDLADMKGIFFLEDADVSQILALWDEDLSAYQIGDDVREFMTTEEFRRYYGQSRAEILADEAFLEEMACDLQAVERLLGGAGDLDEAVLDVMTASMASFQIRNSLLEQSIVDFMGAATDAAMDTKAALARLDGRGRQYSGLDVSRHGIVQRFQVRSSALAAFLRRRFEASGPDCSPRLEEFEKHILRLCEVLGMMVGPMETWSHADLYSAFTAAKRFRERLSAAGRSVQEVERRMRVAYLDLNGILGDPEPSANHREPAPPGA